MSHKRRPVHIAYILRSYPRLSQTFVLHEILELEQLGLCLHVYALTNPHESMVQPEVAEVRSPVRYLEATDWRDHVAMLWAHIMMLFTAPRCYLRCFAYVCQHANLDEGYTEGSRFSCWNMAVSLARSLRHDASHGHAIDHLHAHFAHAPTLVALLTELLTGTPYSFTAHARDVYQLPISVLAERVRRARAVMTCCRANLDYFAQTMPTSWHVQLIRHGIDLCQFQPAIDHPERDHPPLILSVGRLVEKKGFADLIHACHLLKHTGYAFQCVIYGDGLLYSQLADLIERLDLTGHVALAGSCTQQQLVPIYQQADLFALTPFVTDDGDRDGVPNVLIEAMACGVPVVSTTAGGISELITHGQNGLLAAPRNPTAIAALLAVLLDDPQERARLSWAGRQTVVEQFDRQRCAQHVADLFRALLPEPAIAGGTETRKWTTLPGADHGLPAMQPTLEDHHHS